jgi:uncharacterized coiled-coil protein SlyX
MTDEELISRIETLELRFLDQERTLDELTGALLKQEQRIKIQDEHIRRLQEQLRTLSERAVADDGTLEDDVPPHY